MPLRCYWLSAVELVSDEVIHTRVVLLSGPGTAKDGEDAFRRPDYQVKFMDWIDWKEEGSFYEALDDMQRVGPNDVLFSNNDAMCQRLLREQGLTAQTAVLLLAAAGIELVLPSAILEHCPWDDIQAAKEKLAEERRAYISAVARLADQAFDRLKSREYSDTVSWARNEAFFKIAPAAADLEDSLRKLNRKLLSRLKVGFLKEGVPAIGRALIEGGVKGGMRAAAAETLRLLGTSLSERIEGHRVPEAHYAIRLSKLLRAAEK